MVGVLVFWATVLPLHVVQSGLSPVDDFVSDYANGRAGWLFTVGTLVHGAGNVAIAAGLARELRPAPAARLGVAGFALAAVGLIVAGIFRTDPPGAPSTTFGAVHGLATNISFGIEIVALLLLAWGFRQDAGWRDYLGLSVALTLLATSATLWLVIALRTEVMTGLAERVALASFTVWEFTTGLRLARHPRSAKR